MKGWAVDGMILNLDDTGKKWFMDDKRHALGLFLVVKSKQTNVSIWVCLFAFIDFLENH